MRVFQKDKQLYFAIFSETIKHKTRDRKKQQKNKLCNKGIALELVFISH